MMMMMMMMSEDNSGVLYKDQLGDQRLASSWGLKCPRPTSVPRSPLLVDHFRSLHLQRLSQPKKRIEYDYQQQIDNQEVRLTHTEVLSCVSSFIPNLHTDYSYSCFWCLEHWPASTQSYDGGQSESRKDAFAAQMMRRKCKSMQRKPTGLCVVIGVGDAFPTRVWLCLAKPGRLFGLTIGKIKPQLAVRTHRFLLGLSSWLPHCCRLCPVSWLDVPIVPVRKLTGSPYNSLRCASATKPTSIRILPCIVGLSSLFTAVLVFCRWQDQQTRRSRSCVVRLLTSSCTLFR